ncbi:hypothetical protein ACWF9G_02720 [Nocardia sp. NPDC055029]
MQEADRLGRNLLEGLIVLNDRFQRGISVKVLHGIAAGRSARTRGTRRVPARAGDGA